MTFLDALDQAILGKKIRRDHWCEGAYLKRWKHTIKIKYAIHGGLNNWTPTLYELMSDNWETIS